MCFLEKALWVFVWKVGAVDERPGVIVSGLLPFQ